MPFSKKTIKELKTARRYECCEMCASKCPSLENNGLEAAHIILEDSGGSDSPDNALVLCSRCHQVFDRFLKGKIAKAVRTSNKKSKMKYSVPQNWVSAEGRRHKLDKI